MLTVSGTGNFFLTWDNVSSQPIPANATAYQVGTFFAKREVRELEVVFKPVGWTPGRFFKKQIQTAIEELLAVKCKLEPLLANILLRLGFEQGTTPGLTDPDPLLHLCPLSFSLSLFFPLLFPYLFPALLRHNWLTVQQPSVTCPSQHAADFKVTTHSYSAFVSAYQFDVRAAVWSN